ncbi:MAG: glycoside hydrolase family 3 N-terminal domain-containing protein [Ilumatobacteraceae bacterium]
MRQQLPWRQFVALVVAVGVAGCSSGVGTSSEITSSLPTVVTTTSTLVPETTAAGPASTEIPPTSAPTTSTTAPPDTTDAQLLAGERVLCTFSGTTLPDEVAASIAEGRAAGVLLFAGNFASAKQADAMGAAIQSAAARSPSGAPAIVAVDQEGGIVARIPGPPSASAAEMGTWRVDDVRAEAQSTATNLRSWGVNIDLAPVADVARPRSFEDRQHRSFSGDPETAAAAVTAFVEGLHAGGVAATLKHFPGLGSVRTTTDVAPATVAATVDELTSVDFVPFKAGVDAGADAVMMSSAVYSALADGPAVMSTNVIDLLRQQLSFGGVVISDALDTPALAAFGSMDDRALRAASAGVDLLIASDPTACGDMQASLATAITDGRLPIESSRASAQRVDTLRRRLARQAPWPPTP